MSLKRLGFGYSNNKFLDFYILRKNVVSLTELLMILADFAFGSKAKENSLEMQKNDLSTLLEG